MAEVEGRPFLRGTRQFGGSDSGPGCANEASPLSSTGSTHRQSRRKVLVIDDKRPRIYPRYRSSKTGRQPQSHGVVYCGLPSAETVATQCEVFADCLDTSISSEPAPSTETLKDILQTDSEMCQVCDYDVAEMKPVQTEWKLVEETF